MPVQIELKSQQVCTGARAAPTIRNASKLACMHLSIEMFSALLIFEVVMVSESSEQHQLKSLCCSVDQVYPYCRIWCWINILSKFGIRLIPSRFKLVGSESEVFGAPSFIFASLGAMWDIIWKWNIYTYIRYWAQYYERSLEYTILYHLLSIT